MDYEERMRKREARKAHKRSTEAQMTHGIKAKLLHQKRYSDKVTMRKRIKAHEERDVKTKADSSLTDGARPTYLLDRQEQGSAKALSSALKDKRKERAAKYAVPLPKVRGVAEDEVFKVLKTGKRRQKGWKRMVTKATFVGEGFTRKPVKMERFIRPMALRYKKANVTHRACLLRRELPGVASSALSPSLLLAAHWYELTSPSRPQSDIPAAHRRRQEVTSQTSCPDSSFRNPQSPMFTQLGVMTRGTIIEVNVRLRSAVAPLTDRRSRSSVSSPPAARSCACRSLNAQPADLGSWGKYAQLTNNPELDGCVNAVRVGDTIASR